MVSLLYLPGNRHGVRRSGRTYARGMCFSALWRKGAYLALQPDPHALLDQLHALDERARIEQLTAVGSARELLPRLAEAVEDIAMTRPGEALAAAEMVVALAEASGERAARARARQARAQARAYAGAFEEAAPEFFAAIQLADEARAEKQAALARLAAIHALVHLGRFSEALAAGEVALTTFLKLGAQHAAGLAHRSLGGIYQKLGDGSRALDHFERGASMLEEDAVALAQLHSNRGLALQGLNRFAEASAAFHSALATFESRGLAWAGALVEGNLAELASRQGRLAEALRRFERARGRVEGEAAPAELARLLAEQADVLATLGAYRQAGALYQSALPALEQHGMAREAAVALAGVARAALHGGAIDEARRAARDAAARFAALELVVERGQLDILRSAIALADGAAGEARAFARGAVEALGDDLLLGSFARYQLAGAALAEDRTELADATLRRALTDVAKLGIAPLRADLLHMRGRVFARLGRPEAAARTFRNALRVAERVRGTLQAERFRAAFQADRAAQYADLLAAALSLEAPHWDAEAFLTAERAKSRTLLELASRHVDAVGDGSEPSSALAAQLDGTRGALNAAYSALADARFARVSGVDVEALRRRIGVLERDAQAMEARLASAADGATSLRAAPFGADAVRAALGEHEALVEYVYVGDQVAAFVLTRDGLVAEQQLVSRAEVEARLQRLYFQLRRGLRSVGGGDGRRLADTQRELRALDEMLREPLERTLTGAKRLTIVPHGALHALPFPALFDGRVYLLDRVEVAHAISASLLVAQRRGARTGGVMSAVVVGTADEHAPQMAKEAAVVAEAIGEGAVLHSPRPLRADVRAALPKADVIHFACHGQFDPGVPEASGLKLWDGWLSVSELYRLKLRARLVALAGCETGRNVVRAGDEIIGLTRALVAAGAGSLLVSLWPLHDGSALSGMRRFYHEVCADAGSFVGALHAAQRAVRAEGPHPVYWAPFILMGG